jgi:uncharacterized Zn finger protein (UPF0148 family)
MNYDSDEYDYSCERCGKGYFADVGFGGCPTCTLEEMSLFYKEKEVKEELENKKRREEYIKYMNSQEYLNQKDLEIQLCEDYD